MTKPTYDHHTLNPAGGFEPFEACDLPYPNPDALEPVQEVDAMAQRIFTLSQAGKIFGKSPRTMRWWADMGHIWRKQYLHRSFSEEMIRRLKSRPRCSYQYAST
jgi:hypothetical protein